MGGMDPHQFDLQARPFARFSKLTPIKISSLAAVLKTIQGWQALLATPEWF